MYKVFVIIFFSFCPALLFSQTPDTARVQQQIAEVSRGDTDTNASMAAQIAGALLGVENIPSELISGLKTVDNYDWMVAIIEKTKNYIG